MYGQIGFLDFATPGFKAGRSKFILNETAFLFRHKNPEPCKMASSLPGNQSTFAKITTFGIPLTFFGISNSGFHA
jgi:hypothetical protein